MQKLREHIENNFLTVVNKKILSYMCECETDDLDCKCEEQIKEKNITISI